MADRKKLTELVKDVLDYLPWGQISSHTAKEIADHLVENGVTFAKDNNVLTNGDRVREMTDEELAVLLMCPYGSEPDMCCAPGTCLYCCEEWLKQEAE